MLENNAFLHYKSTAFRCHERLPLHSMKRMVFHVGYGYISGCSLFSFTHDRKGDLLSITDYQQIALKRSKTEDAVRRSFWNSFAGCMDICQPKLSAAAVVKPSKGKTYPNIYLFSSLYLFTLPVEGALPDFRWSLTAHKESESFLLTMTNSQVFKFKIPSTCEFYQLKKRKARKKKKEDRG